MIALFATTLAFLAQPLPAITCAEKNKDGECVFDYAGKPLRRIHALHTDRAVELYRPYFVCYYKHLISDEHFGTDDGQQAIAAMHAAREDCAVEEALSENGLDSYLVSKELYGDEENRRLVRELFRREAGGSFVYNTARANGLGVEIKTMGDAIFNEGRSSDD